MSAFVKYLNHLYVLTFLIVLSQFYSVSVWCVCVRACVCVCVCVCLEKIIEKKNAKQCGLKEESETQIFPDKKKMETKMKISNV